MIAKMVWKIAPKNPVIEGKLLQHREASFANSNKLLTCR